MVAVGRSDAQTSLLKLNCKKVLISSKKRPADAGLEMLKSHLLALNQDNAEAAQIAASVGVSAVVAVGGAATVS